MYNNKRFIQLDYGVIIIFKCKLPRRNLVLLVMGMFSMFDLIFKKFSYELLLYL